VGNPGASLAERPGPRLRPTVIVALVVILLVAGGSVLYETQNVHQDRQSKVDRRAAERALAGLRLPSGVTRLRTSSSCTSSAATVCATSTRPPEDLKSALESLLNGRANDLLCKVVAQPQGQPCPVTIYGKVAGYPAVANVHRHLLLVKTGRPPAGAVPLHAGATHGIFFLGADLNISLVAAG
jgi:hypothetical protein